MGRPGSLTVGEGSCSSLFVAGRSLLPLLLDAENASALDGTKGFPCRCEAACAK